MTGGNRFLGFLPPLLVGFAAAGAAEMSAGLLLYSAEGFLPALTLILTVELGAFAFGLWNGSAPAPTEIVEGLRTRWFFSLVAFALAAAFSAGMLYSTSLLSSGLGQGLGLAFLGSLPLFALGSLLGAMAEMSTPSVEQVALPAIAGAVLGFLLTGALFLPNMAPYTLYLLCLSALSGGAVLQGWSIESQSGDEPPDEDRTV